MPRYKVRSLALGFRRHGLPFVSHGDVRIHYRLEGAGPPLVLVHGFASSSEQFYSTGWVPALKDRYRLIMLDARGHGESDKPHEPAAYRMELQVGDVTAVLDELGIRKARFLGYSMGGNLGFGMAMYAPDRVTCLIIGGGDTEDPDPAHPSPGSERMLRILRSGLEARLAVYRENAEKEIRASTKPSALQAILPERLRLVLESDPEALAAIVVWWQQEVLRLNDVLPRVAIPCLLFAGDADPAFEGMKAAAALIPGARFLPLPGLAHFEAAVRLDLLLPHVLRFLEEVDARGPTGRPA